MYLAPISSASPLNHNQSNCPNIGGDVETNGLLMTSDRSIATTGWLQPYIEISGRVDPSGYVECVLSVCSSVVSTTILCLHGLEKYHENHKEVLTAELINLFIIASFFAKGILSCLGWSISLPRTLNRCLQWLQPNSPLEQEMVINNSSITQKPKNYLWSFVQWAEKINDPLYYGLQSSCFVIFLISFYLHATEKDHENHAAMLRLETLNAVYSISLGMIKIIKTVEQNRKQTSLLPQNSVRLTNYQTI